MSKRDLLKKANAGNAQNRGTEAVLNDTPKIIPQNENKITTAPANSPIKTPIIEDTKETTEKLSVSSVKEIVKDKTVLSKSSKKTVSSNFSKYTGSKVSKSIMLTAEDNLYLIKTAAASKKSIQDVFGEIMADEIEEVKKGNINHELADSFLRLRANNERRNAMLPSDLIKEISDTAALIPLKQGKFILYALYKKRTNN